MKKDYKDLFYDCFGHPKVGVFGGTKSHLVTKMLPAQRVVDFGGMHTCNGYYSFLAAAGGVKDVLLLDLMTTDRFNKINQNFPNVRYIKMDFYKSMLSGELKALGEKYPAEAAICYDVLLHQPEPIHFISNMISAFALERAVFANPVTKQSTDHCDLFFAPFSDKFVQGGDGIRYSTGTHDHGGWVWLFSHGFLLNCMKYLKLHVAEEILIPNWLWMEGLDYSLILVEKR